MLRENYKTNNLFKTAAALIIISAAFIKAAVYNPEDKISNTADKPEVNYIVSSEQSSESTLYLPKTDDVFSETTLFNPEETQIKPHKTDVSSFEKEDIKVLNNTSLRPDYWSLLQEELDFDAAIPDEPSVLIIHTHASEAYTPSEKYPYEPTDPSRTEDTAYNMVRVGEEIASGLIKAGIGVYHERELFDYPSYNGSYTRALNRINELLVQYPTIQFVLDIHRDALITSDGTEYAGTCSINGEEAAQILIVSGTGEGGLSHDGWKDNLKFALQLERMMTVKYEGLVRNLNLRSERFNQHATKGSLIIEVGCTGNTLDQALCAARACQFAFTLNALSVPL